MMNFLDTHDTDRIASMIANRKRKTNRGYNASNRVAKKEDQYLPANLREEDTPLLELAAFLQMTWPGSPMIYYGTEAGMWGGGDPDNRMPMIWEDLKYEDQASDPLRRPRKPDPVAFSKKRFEFYQKLISFRQSHPVLMRGDVEMVAGQSADDLLAFCRSLDGTHFFILINRGPRERTLRLPGAWNDLPARHWEPLYITTGNLGEIRLTQVGQRNGIQIPGESGAVLRVQRP
jgi:glycosidase